MPDGKVLDFAKENNTPDYMGEMQLACQAASVIASHFSRPRRDVLERILANIREQVHNHYKAIGITFD